MIIKIHRSGRSFKGVVAYLSHDVKADTAARVAWTHTINLAEDHLPSAVNEMLVTYQAADSLKRAAGISTGGSQLQRPVKHFSVGWHVSEHPTPEHMHDTLRKYLEHMGWDDRQAIVVAHSDKRHPHIHVVLNVVSPADGRALRDFQEHRRTEVFCLAYEREQGQIFCEQRLKPKGERDPTPTRESWLKLKEAETAQERQEREPRELDYFSRGDQSDARDREWKVLKALQRDQRDAFRASSKQQRKEVRNAIYNGVRNEFRPEWRAYYEAARGGGDKEELAEIKASILKRQNEALDKRCKEEYEFLGWYRGGHYAALLSDQKHDRAGLRERQTKGIRSFDLLDGAYPPHPSSHEAEKFFSTNAVVATRRVREPWIQREDMRAAFRKAAPEVTAPAPRAKPEREARPAPDDRAGGREPRFKVRGGLDAVGGIGLGALGALASFGERLFDGFLGGGETSKPEPRRRRIEKKEPEIETEVSGQKAIEARASEEAALQAYWNDRRQRRRERD
jgi:hypothetical protein